MTGNHETDEKVRNADRSPGNLGQKKAEAEEAAEEMFEHMGGDDTQKSDKPERRKGKSGKC